MPVWLLVKPFLSGAWKFLKGLPWELWLGIAILALAWFWGHLQYNAGQRDVQTKFDQYKSVMIQRTEAARVAANRAEVLSRTASEAAKQERDKGLEDAKNTAKAIADGIKRGTVRLRPQWRSCPNSLPGTNPNPGGSDESADLRAEGAGNLVGNADAADTEITYFQGLVKAHPQCFTIK